MKCMRAHSLGNCGSFGHFEARFWAVGVYKAKAANIKNGEKARESNSQAAKHLATHQI